MLLFLSFFCLKLNSVLTAAIPKYVFPEHLDLQKVGEIKLNNEKYNILKYSKHIVTDYFQDTMLRRDTSFPTESAYVDKEGFRHYWSSLKRKSLRKNNVDENVITETTKAHDEINDKVSSTSPNDEVTVTTDSPNNAVTVTTVSTNDEVTTTVTEVTEVTTKRGPKRTKRTTTTEGPEKKIPLRAGAGKTAYKTSFFCPFYGVITMTSIE